MKSSTTSSEMRQQLAIQPQHHYDLADFVGKPPNIVYSLLFNMKTRKQIYIFNWVRWESGKWVAVWALGQKKDKPKPRPLTKQEVQSRYWKKYRMIFNARLRKRPATWKDGL